MNSDYHALHFPGIRPDSLGEYLTGLGLLSACSKEWPSIRGCWKDGYFVLLCNQNENRQENDIVYHLKNTWVFPKYPTNASNKLIWNEQQKKDTKKKMTIEIQKLRSGSSLEVISFMDSHLVSTTKNVFNPIFGSGGNIGKRNLSKVTTDSKEMINKANDQKNILWIRKTLFGKETILDELQSTGTWFVYANKTYNSGQNDFYREGRLSPWSFLLALEGALLLKGNVGRRLTAKARPYAVFPFISDSKNPIEKDSVGLKLMGEFWAPLWEYPTTINELCILLRRGLIKLGNRAATAPHEFGVAVLGIGVDAGIRTFVPFELRETTSSQVFEAIPKRDINVHKNESNNTSAELLAKLSSWVERLPFEPKDNKQKGKFIGLRGPVEQAIIEVTEEPNNSNHWQSLLLQIAEVQKRIDLDRTRNWKQRCIALPQLSLKWLDKMWPEGLPREVEIACSIASIGGGTNNPILVNIFGVEIKTYPYFPKNRPPTAVWHDGELNSVLMKIFYRRIINEKPNDPWPLEATYPIDTSSIVQYLNGKLDEDEITRWIPALSLLNWRKDSIAKVSDTKPSDGVGMADAFFRPLITSGLSWKDCETERPSSNFCLKLINLLQQGEPDIAIDFAVSRYHALGRIPCALPVISADFCPRLAAGLIIPTAQKDVYKGRECWLLPVQLDSA